VGAKAADFGQSGERSGIHSRVASGVPEGGGAAPLGSIKTNKEFLESMSSGG